MTFDFDANTYEAIIAVKTHTYIKAAHNLQGPRAYAVRGLIGAARTSPETPRSKSQIK